MAQPEKSFEYKGHHVEIDVTSIGKKFGWWYSIDGEETHKLDESGCRTEELAIQEAAHDARNRIDRRSAAPAVQ